jgi:hypothetical protein
MTSGLVPKPHQETLLAESLRGHFARMQEALKTTLELVNAATTHAARIAAAGSIHELVKETERLKRQIDRDTVILVSDYDDYVAAAMRSIIPKLPALIENKREELLEKDLEQFVASIMPSDPMRDVLLDIEFDNVAMRERFVKSHKCFDSKTIAKNAGYKTSNLAQTAWRWKKGGQIFSIDYFGRELFPAFQFRDGKPLPQIKKILDVIAKDLTPWQIAFWFVAENGWLDGVRPIDAMLRSEEAVIEAARRAVERAEY